MESFNVELNLRNNKWLVNCSFNPHKSFIGNHLDAVSTEAAGQRCSEKKVFLEISQNSQENTCAKVSFLIKLQVEAWHWCFPVNLKKFLRKPIL